MDPSKLIECILPCMAAEVPPVWKQTFTRYQRVNHLSMTS